MAKRVTHEGGCDELHFDRNHVCDKGCPRAHRVVRYGIEETKARRAFFAAAERVAMRNTKADMLALVRALSDWKRVEKARGR